MWNANYLNEIDHDWDYGNFNPQEVLALSYLAALRRQVTDVGLTYLAAFDGRHRSGKSIAASLLGYLWDPTFWTYYESRLVQEPREFMDCLERIDKDKVNGAVIQVDEAGVSMANSEWYERWMKTLTKTVQMFGYLHPVVFFVAPIKDFVDSRLRRMFHAYYSVSRFSTEYSVIQPYNVHYSTIKNKWYYRKPIVRVGGQRIKIEKINLGKPPAFILERYAEYEKGIKSRMLKDFIADMRKEETKQVKEKKDLNVMVEWVANNFKLFATRHSKPDRVILDQVLVKHQFELTIEEAHYVKTHAERKVMEKLREIAESINPSSKPELTKVDVTPTPRKADQVQERDVMGETSDIFG